MANFDVSFLNSKLRKSSGGKDYGFLVDQLEILKNTLESDGKLSPGDYNLLNQKAMEVYSHPGLTPAQRSNIEVKMSSFKSDKSKTEISDMTDISRLNREVQDDYAKINIKYANNPSEFLDKQAYVQKAKIDRLSESIDKLEQSGQDTSSYQNELVSSLQDYQDTLTALDDVEKVSTGEKPKSDFAAYVVTNSNGEVVSMKVGRVGSQSGYLPTNGTYGGLLLYGKQNRRDGDKAVFQIGTTEFKESQNLVVGPDGAKTQSLLISGVQSRGGFTKNAPDVAIDPVTVRTQSSVRDGGWIEGEKGFLYQKNNDGSYKKYVNADKEKLGITDNMIIKMPRSFVQGINGAVTETVDQSAQPVLPLPTVPTDGSAVPQSNLSTTTPSQTRAADMQDASVTGGGRPNTGGAPTERAPFSAGGIASKVSGAAKSFFGGLFGQK